MAKLFLNDENFTVSDDVEVIGGAGTEGVLINGTPNIQLDANIERVDLSGNVADYEFLIAGTTITILSGGVAVATFASLNQDVTVKFADGSANLGLTGLETATLGDTALPTDTAAAVVPSLFDTTDTSSTAGGSSGGDPSETFIDVAIDTAAFPSQTDFDAAGDGYNFIDDAAVSNYAVIDNFTADDTISFVNAVVDDYTFSNEGEDVTLSYNYNDEGTMNVIELTGVVSSDALVYDQASFTEAAGFDAFG